MPPLIEAIIRLAVGIAALLLIFTPRGRSILAVLLTNLVQAAFDVYEPVLISVETVFASVAATFLKSIQGNAPGIANQITGPAGDLANASIAAKFTALGAFGTSEPTNVGNFITAAIADAFGNGMASHTVSTAFEAAVPKSLQTLNAFGPLLASMAGFEKVADNILDPLYEATIGKSLGYALNGQFKPDFPDEADAVLWHARGLLTDDQLKAIFDVSGLKAEYETAFITSAYRAVSPFILARATATGAISSTDLTDVLTFGGYRPVDISRLLTAFADVAIDPYRRRAVQAFVAAAEDGLYTGTAITDELNTLGVLPAAVPWVTKEIGYRRLIKLSNLYIKSIDEGYRYGTISDADYIPDLENIGLGQDLAGAHYAAASVAKIGKAAVKAASDAAKLANERTKADVKTLSEQYLTGVIDAAGLTAGLALTALDPAIAGFVIAFLAARKAASQKYVFGVPVTEVQGQLLREKVDAVKYQVDKAGLGQSGATAALLSYGIPQDQVNALIAYWFAEYRATVLQP